MKRAAIIILILALLGAGGYFIYTRYTAAQAAAKNNYNTVAITRGDLTATVGGTGTVRANQTTTVNWQTSGRIARINVKEGDQVSPNQVLAELDPLTLSQTIIQARADLVTAQRNLDSLKSSGTARAQAEQALANAQKALEDAKNERYRKNLGRASQASIAQVQADLIIAKDKLKTAQEIYDKFATRPENDVMRANAFSSLAAAQQKVDQLNNNLDWLESFPEPNEVAIADAGIAVAQAKLDDAQREWDRLKNGADPQDIAAAQARVDSIQASLALTTLKAPISGAITDIKSMTGDQVSNGTVSFRIDDLSHLLVDVQITEVDINKIKIGQPARMTFDAIASKEYNGKVIEVSAFGTTTSGVVNFTVTIELTQLDNAVKPGMTAAVNIVVDQLNNVLQVPNRAVRLREGQRVVYILQSDGSTLPVPVKIGAIADQTSQIESGDVKEGDLVVTNPTVEIKSPASFGSMGR